MVEGEGFEPSYSERTDLQSVAFNHSATPPNRTCDYDMKSRLCQTAMGARSNAVASFTMISQLTDKFLMIKIRELVPDVGIELTTFALQVRCSTN